MPDDDPPRALEHADDSDRRASALLELARQGERDIVGGGGLSLEAHRAAMQARLRANR